MLKQQTKQAVKYSQSQEFQSSRKLLQLAKQSHEQYLLKQQQIDLENAIDYYIRAMKLTPHMSEPYYKLAILLYNKKQISLEQALNQCKKAVMLDPDCPKAKLYYGYFLNLSGQTRQAKQEFSKASIIIEAKYNGWLVLPSVSFKITSLKYTSLSNGYISLTL